MPNNQRGTANNEPEFNADAQRKLAKQFEAEAEARRNRERATHVSTLLSTDAYVGKILAEPHKPQEMEDLKVGTVARTMVEEVKTAPRKTGGETTDLVVVDPEPALAAGSVAPTEAEAVRAIVEKHSGRSRETGEGSGKKAEPETDTLGQGKKESGSKRK